MTKAELEKEAEKYLDEKCKDCYMCSYDEHKDPYRVCQRRKDRKQAYLAGAEPREKRIAELEQKLEQTEKDLADYQFNYPTIKELQKENAELRNTETMLKVLKDRGVIKSWYYNGSYHVGNELPR